MRHPLSRYRIPRSLVSSKGSAPPMSLEEPRCIEPSNGRDYGRLVSTIGDSEIVDHEAIIMQRLEGFRADGLIRPDLYEQAASALTELHSLVEGAIRAFLEQGLAWKGWSDFAHSYAGILQSLHNQSPGPLFHREVIAPLTRVGITEIGHDSRPTVICTPLHPLRLTALYVRSHQMAAEIKSRLDPAAEFLDSGLHDSTLDLDSAHPYYPEVLVCGNSVLSMVSSIAEYSLMQEAAGEDSIDTADDAPGAAKVLEGVVADYVKLHPHEKTNLSVLLHTVASGGFPAEVVSRFSRSHVSELAEAKCRLVLQDSDRSRLQKQYRSFVSSMDTSATDSHPLFLSRFRVDATRDLDDVEGLEAGDIDLAFLLDRASREAKVRWKAVRPGELPDFTAHYPARWARREPSSPHATHSGTYLCCPVNPHPVSVYYTVLGALLEENGEAGLIPVRVVEYDSSRLKATLTEAHRAAKWVVNYDGLINRSQLRQHLKVDIVRYRPSRKQGRNLIVSSGKPPYLLNAHLATKLKHFDLLEPENREARLSALRKRANDLSGGLILKAAGRGRFTNELLGAVLSAQLLSMRLPEVCRKHAVYVYLDDFGNLFSNRATLAGDIDKEASVLADILCIVPMDPPETSRVLLMVSEVKFLSGQENLAMESERSRQQLLATVEKLTSLAEGDTVDRHTWLSTLANTVLDAGQFIPGSECDPEAVSWKIRAGLAELSVVGHSHIFIADREDEPHWTKIGGNLQVWQGVIGRPQIKVLLDWLTDGTDGQRLPDTDSLFDGLPALDCSYPVGSQQKSGNAEEEVKTEPDAVGAGEQAHGDVGEASDRTGVSGDRDCLPAQPSGFKWAPAALAAALSEIDDPLATEESATELEMRVREVEQMVKDFLPSFEIRTKLGESSITPNAWRIRLKGQVGVDPAKIDRLRDQFKTVKGLELIRAEAEKGHIALSFRRDRRGPVSYLDCLREREVTGQGSNSLVLLGRREDNGKLLYHDLRGADTHALVGGMSNSGKTQLLSTMILDLLLTNSPDHLRLVLIDPKKVEFVRFKSVPHLHGVPIVTEMEDTIALLNKLVQEMEQRYDRLASKAVNELSKYNAVADVSPIPRLVVVFDEFADWMLDENFKRAVNDSFQRLAGKARAAGIHLILSTQRPDNTVVSPILRANLGAKIALRVDKKANSEIILDEPGAERLLGRGHGLARLGGERVLFQAAYAPDEVQASLISLVARCSGGQ